MKCLIHQSRAVGFFSSFNAIAASLKTMRDRGIQDFNIKWYNALYQSTPDNLFDIYFYNQTPLENFDEVHPATTLNSDINSPIIQRDPLIKLHKALTHFDYFNNKIFKQCKEAGVDNVGALGVHVRGTDHHEHGELLKLEYYFTIIDEELVSQTYNHLYLMTDETRIVDAFRDKYGDFVKINTGITRSSSTTAIHYSQNPFPEKLVLDVMTDAISLAACEKIIVTASNVAGYSLMVNPYIKYRQIDTHIVYR